MATEIATATGAATAPGVVTVPVALTEQVAEQIDPMTVLEAVKTREQADKVWNHSIDCNEDLIHAVNKAHGGFAWEVIQASLREGPEGKVMAEEEFQDLREKAMAVIRGEHTLEEVAAYVQDVNLHGEITHAGVAFMVMAAKHMLNEDVEIRRYHNHRFRGWVIRPVTTSAMQALVETHRYGTAFPAVAIVTDKNDMTRFISFKECWKATFKGISNWEGQTFNTIGYYDEPSSFVAAIQGIVEAFNKKEYSFLED